MDEGDSSLSPSGASRQPRLNLPATVDPPSSQNPPKQAVWIIFGATGHMGHSLAKAALAHGDKVTAVGWTQENSIEQLQRWQEPNSLWMLCDVRVRATVEEVIRRSIEKWGKVDVVTNCTGYGVIGACEDQDEHDLRNQFETNVYGTLNIIQLSLPYFRSRSYGRYLIFSSTCGALGVPGMGPYCATKYAVEGLIESMLYEVDAFNIKATLVEPGQVRLDEPDSAAHHLRKFAHFYVKKASPPYAGPNAPAGHAKRMVQWLNDRQPTSAVKSAELVWQLAHCSYPPLRLLLGTYAVDSIRDRLRSIIEEIEDWKHLSFPSADEEPSSSAKDKGKEKEDEKEEEDGE